MTDEMPPPKATKEFSAPDKTAILLAEMKALMVSGNAAITERVETGFKSVKADMDLLGGQFESLERDVRGLQSWRVRTEDRQAAASIRVRENSSIDLAQDAKLANALAALAEEKAARLALEKNAATKADLEAVTKAQTSAIVSAIGGVSALAEKSPMVRTLLMAFAGLVFMSITAATTYLSTLSAQKQAPHQVQP